MEIKDLLPIGSVIRLKNGEKRLMIVGIKQQDANDPAKEYDYLGEMYPEGHIGEGFQYLFNNDDIEQVYFRGFEDEERTEFLKALTEALKNKN